MATLRQQIVDNMVSVVGAVAAFTGRVFEHLPEDPSVALEPTVYIAATDEDVLQSEFGFELKGLGISIVLLKVHQLEGAAESGSDSLDDDLVLIERALRVDVTRGGLAIDTEIGRMEMQADTADAALIVGRLTCVVTYRHKYGDPEVAA